MKAMMIPARKEKHEELSDENNESYSEDDSGDNENDSEESEDDDNDSLTEKIKDEDEAMDAEEENEMSGDDQADIKEEKDSKIHQNPGWADAMAKILKTNKPKRKKTIVLAKAKKLKPTSHEDGDDSDKKPQTFEIDGMEEKPKIKTDKDSPVKSEAKMLKSQLELARIRRKELIARGRVKPTVLDKDREKVLMKVATKGVVQLFNAVRQQQKSLEQEIKEVGPSNTRRDNVLKSVDKRAFLDVLMGAKSETVPEVKEEPVSTGEWAVLRNDFMMSSKLKDWDKDENDTET